MKEVAESAQQAFRAAFPPRKHADVLTVCREDILQHIRDNLSHTSAQSLCSQDAAKSIPPEQQQEKYERVLTSSLYALSHVISTSNSEGLAGSAMLAGLLDGSGFWKRFVGHPAPSVRRGAYALVAALADRHPGLVRARLPAVAPLVLGAFGDKEPSNHAAMWEAVLHLLHSHPQAVEHASLRKAVVPRLWEFMRQAGYGSVQASFGSLVALLSLLPRAVVTEDPRFLPEWFACLRAALDAPALGSPHGSYPDTALAAVVAACVECCLYVVFSLAMSDDVPASRHVAATVLPDWVLHLLASSRVAPSSAETLLAPTSPLPKALAKLSLKAPAAIAALFWDTLYARLSTAEPSATIQADRLAKLLHGVHGAMGAPADSPVFRGFVRRTVEWLAHGPQLEALAALSPDLWAAAMSHQEDAMALFFRNTVLAWPHPVAVAVGLSLLRAFPSADGRRAAWSALIGRLDGDLEGLACLLSRLPSAGVLPLDRSGEQWWELPSLDRMAIGVLPADQAAPLARDVLARLLSLRLLSDAAAATVAASAQQSMQAADMAIAEGLLGVLAGLWEGYGHVLSADLRKAYLNLLLRLKLASPLASRQWSEHAQAVVGTLSEGQREEVVAQVVSQFREWVAAASPQHALTLGRHWAELASQVGPERLAARLGEVLPPDPPSLPPSPSAVAWLLSLAAAVGLPSLFLVPPARTHCLWLLIASAACLGIADTSRRDLPPPARRKQSVWPQNVVSALSALYADLHMLVSPEYHAAQEALVGYAVTRCLRRGLLDDDLGPSTEAKALRAVLQLVQPTAVPPLLDTAIASIRHAFPASPADEREHALLVRGAAEAIRALPAGLAKSLPALLPSISAANWAAELTTLDKSSENQRAIISHVSGGLELLSAIYEDCAVVIDKGEEDALRDIHTVLHRWYSSGTVTMAVGGPSSLATGWRFHGSVGQFLHTAVHRTPHLLKLPQLEWLFSLLVDWLAIRQSSVPTEADSIYAYRHLLYRSILLLRAVMAQRHAGPLFQDLNLHFEDFTRGTARPLLERWLEFTATDDTSHALVVELSRAVNSVCSVLPDVYSPMIDLTTASQIADHLGATHHDVQRAAHAVLAQVRFASLIPELKALAGAPQYTGDTEPAEPDAALLLQHFEMVRWLQDPAGRTLEEEEEVSGEEPIEQEDELPKLSTKAQAFCLAADLLCHYSGQDAESRALWSSYARQQRVLAELLSAIFAQLEERQKMVLAGSLSLGQQSTVNATHLIDQLAALYLRVVETFPALTRQWWSDEYDRNRKAFAEKFTIRFVSPLLIAREVQRVHEYSHDYDNFHIKASLVTHEITAVYEKEELALTLILRLPASYPLRPVEAECTNRAGVSEQLWRKWQLSMTTLLLTKDGSLLDAVLLWKQNLDKHFEGAEPCTICYCIFNASNSSLPNLACKTCKNKFHSACLYKWFKSSNKSECPLCKSTFNFT